jgi:hypothetical protein
VGSVFVFSLTAVFNPTLLAAVTLMLTLPSTIAATETASCRVLMFSAGLRLGVGGRYGPRSGSRAVPEPNGHHGRTP